MKEVKKTRVCDKRNTQVNLKMWGVEVWLASDQSVFGIIQNKA